MILSSALSILALSAVVLLLGAAQQAQADFVLHNARIYTIQPDQPSAEALAVRGNRILAVGSGSSLLQAHPQAEALDAGGRAVVPGFIDAHAHLMGQGLSMLEVDLKGATSPEEVVDRLAGAAANLPERAWLTGHGWDQNRWPGQDFPTRHELDRAFPDRPVYLTRIDTHAAWVNTAALQAAGMEQLPEGDPEGGRIVRDAQGAPTGIFIDTAMELVSQHRPAPTEAERHRALELALDQTARFGLTGVHDAGIGLQEVMLFREAIDRDAFDLRLYGMIDGCGETFKHFRREGPLIGYGDRLTVRSVKFFMDGALGSRGAALLEAYSDDPGNRGLLLREPDVFLRAVRRVMAAGFQVNTHAIGDRAVRAVLDAYAKALEAERMSGGRHRVEHAQVVHPDDVSRFAELGVIASVQPVHATSDRLWAEARLGSERLSHAYRAKSLLEAGARLAFGSDFPVEPVNPLLGFHAAVTRQDAGSSPEGGWLPQERVSRQQALRGFTIDAAYAAFQEDQMGSIEAGKYADFVVLSDDIMQIPAEDIPNASVVATYLGGKRIYGSGE